MKTIKTLLIGLPFLFFTINCSKNSTVEPSDNTPPPSQNDTTSGNDSTSIVKYNPDVQAIMNQSCVNCHSGPSASAGLRLTNYNEVRNSTENDNLLIRINSISNPMPPGGLLPQSQRDVVSDWANGGYVEN